MGEKQPRLGINMNYGFWKNLSKPFFALAPMADVTDPAFRRIITKYSRYGGHDIGDGSKESLPDEAFRVGGPDVMWTEFVSADGLCHPSGRDALMKDLAFTEAERPIVAQLFSSNVENMRSAAKLCAELGFDGIDINMGCPDRTIEKQGCGAAMIKTPDVAAQIIQAAKDGVSDAGREIPVSVKTRIGYSTNEMETWLPFLLRQNIAALTVHLRTRKELSSVSARWNLMSRIVEIRNEIAPDTIILGNGDITDLVDAERKAVETGCDGVMIGRAIFGNPFLFKKEKGPEVSTGKWITEGRELLYRIFFRLGLIRKNKYWLRHRSNVSLAEKLRVLVEHAELFEKLLPHKNFAVMKKHFKAYVNGFPARAGRPGARELRMKLMETDSVKALRVCIDAFFTRNN